MEIVNLLLDKLDLFVGLIIGLVPSYMVARSARQQRDIEKELKFFESYFIKKCSVYSKFYEEYSKSFATPDSIPDFEGFECALSHVMLFAPSELIPKLEDMDKAIVNRKIAYNEMADGKIDRKAYLDVCTDCADKRKIVMNALNRDIANCRKVFQEEKEKRK